MVGGMGDAPDARARSSCPSRGAAQRHKDQTLERRGIGSEPSQGCVDGSASDMLRELQRHERLLGFSCELHALVPGGFSTYMPPLRIADVALVTHVGRLLIADLALVTHV